MSNDIDSPLVFSDEPDPQTQSARRAPWKLLIVDDEEEVHEVTRLALAGFEFKGGGLQILSALSAEEGRQLMHEHPDVAVMLLDVVMETDHAGLEFTRFVREELGNRFVRIILRTGQPGQAPVQQVVKDYDINDYKHKTELTQQKLFTTIYTSLSSYRDLIALDANRRGLENVIAASAKIFRMRSMAQFAAGVLEQVTALLYLDRDAFVVSAIAAERHNGTVEIMAGSGVFEGSVGRDLREVVEPEIGERVQQALERRHSVAGSDYYVGYHRSDDGWDHLIYVSGPEEITVANQKLMDLFVENVGIAYENIRRFEHALGDGSGQEG